jgi:hypothetical protein
MFGSDQRRITMSQPPRYLPTKLAEPPPAIDGGVLRTVGDAIT